MIRQSGGLMNRKLLSRTALLVATVLLVVSSSRQTGAQTPPKSGSQSENVLALTKTDRFEGKTVLKLKTGRPQEVSVAMRSWALHGRLQVDKFPEHDFLVVYLHSGKVTTVIDGKQEQHKGGDFWTVPAAASMSIHVTSESALLQTLAIRK
jgi:hypothetical protein